jgi:hypothetical protein
MKVAEIYEKLGLQDPIAFARQRVVANLAPERVADRGVREVLNEVHRGIGSTTYMLCCALEDISEGRRAVFRMMGDQDRRCFKEAQRMAESLGLDGTLLVPASRSHPLAYVDEAWRRP